MIPPWGVPSSVGVNPLPASNTPAFSQLATMSLAGNAPSRSRRKECRILSNADVRSATRIHVRFEPARSVLQSASAASWQLRPGRNP
jgi:hypothetical protein